MKSRKELNILQRITLELVWGFCRLIAAMPHCVQYRVVAPALRFLLYRVVGYRKRVVCENLRNSFPEKTEQERMEICAKFYGYLSEAMLSTIALASSRASQSMIVTESADTERNVISIRNEIGDRSLIALTAHYGLWEYQLFWSTFTNQRLLAVYHRLANPVFEELFKRLRSRHHKVQPLPAKESLRFVVKHGREYLGESYLLGLIADQSPHLRPHSIWYKFLNQDTIFYDGGEKIALKIKLPVIFVYQHRHGAGRYEMRFRMLWDGEEEIAENEITARYVAMLEEVIKNQPELWLWTHRRWKAKRRVE